ncbi:DUF2786 domain-containing protein [Actinopolymorpha rutila]|uniref:DUF2786 domain-containing protein n=1 Tax=Actinopolymorpha rutila TaxID=446787 RepID=A0A852Z9G7_9ACTN|nr:hypothetical protein [Actinopolymorpha rutila]
MRHQDLTTWAQALLWETAQRAAEGARYRWEHAACELADPGLPPQVIDGVVDDCLTGAVGRLWERGWQPQDVAEFAARRLSLPARQLALDVAASQAARYPRSTLDPRWRSQLEELETSRHWAADAARLTPWAMRRRLDRVEALRLALAVLTFLYAAPALASVLPPPGRSGAHEAGGRGQNGDAGGKVLHRIRALLAKAESTEFPEEAEALSSKAQALMTKFSLDQAMVAADSAGSSVGAAEAHANARRVWLRAPYLNAKALLAQLVAEANRSRVVACTEMGFVTIVGAEADLQLVELLLTSLLLQADRAMLAASPSARAGGHSRTRSWRQSFLVSYATRIGQRLGEASQTSMAEYDADTSGRLLPALKARDHAVQQLVTELFPRIRSAAVSTSNPAGWAAGKLAADLADLADLGARRGVGRAAS